VNKSRDDLEPTRAAAIPLDRLRSATRLPLSQKQVSVLSKDWGGRDAERSWSDIEWVAQQFMRQSSSDPVDAAVAWHHLVVAVGNFKRSTGRNYPVHLPLPDLEFQPSDHFTIPGYGLDVDVSGAKTWGHLTKAIHGFDVPTATTLLSAVWPGRHVIIDRRDIVAAVGLTTTAWDSRGYEDAKLPPRKPYYAYWDLYEWLLPVIRATAVGVSPVEVERALYVLDIKVRKLLPPKEYWHWSRYTEIAAGILADTEAQFESSS
jgi:hypothetical protein